MTPTLNAPFELSTDESVRIFCAYGRKLNIWGQSLLHGIIKVSLLLSTNFILVGELYPIELRLVMKFAFISGIWGWMTCATSEKESCKPLWDSAMLFFHMACAWTITEVASSNALRNKEDLEQNQIWSALTWVKNNCF